MTPIVHDMNSMEMELDRPENKELADLIIKQVHYAVTQRPRLVNQPYLITLTTYNLLKIFKEYPMMVDGRNNINEINKEPF